MKFLQTTLPVLAALVLPTLASAEEQTHVISTQGSVALVPRFDPHMGQLEGVRIECQVTFEGGLGFENLSSGPNLVHASFGAAATVRAPGGADLVQVLPLSLESDHVLPPFDGTVDFGGASGRTFAGLLVSGEGESTFSADAAWQVGFAAAEGPIPLTIDVIDMVEIHGNARLAKRHGLRATSVVTVHYEYAPVQD